MTRKKVAESPSDVNAWADKAWELLVARLSGTGTLHHDQGALKELIADCFCVAECFGDCCEERVAKAEAEAAAKAEAEKTEEEAA